MSDNMIHIKLSNLYISTLENGQSKENMLRPTYSHVSTRQFQFIYMTNVSSYAHSKGFMTEQKISVSASPSTHFL